MGSGEMKAVESNDSPYRGNKQTPTPFVPLNDKEREVQRRSGAASFDRLIEEVMLMNASVRQQVRVSYATLVFLSLIVGLFCAFHR